MKNKIYSLLILTIIFGIILSGCGSSSQDMNTMTAEDSIESFFPFDDSLLESEFTRNKIESYLLQINPDVDISEGHYAIGDLTGDEIPEIAMYIKRNPANIDDQGSLLVYSYDSSEYVLTDKVHMNYDNTNYILKIGNISDNVRGLLLSNQVGSKAGVTYGFILEERSLKNILNPKKVNLFSVTTSNSIMDIDGDGILEFSICSIDPETTADNPSDADIIELWYRWNGKDSADFIDISENASEDSMIVATPRESQMMEAPQEFGIMTETEESQIAVMTIDEPYPGNTDYRDYLIENLDNYSAMEVTNNLKEHIFSLKVNKSYRSLDVATLFSKYMKDYSFDSFFEKYGLSQERLNDEEYLGRDRILQSESDLKEMMIRNLDLGYLLVAGNGKYNYEIDYGGFVDDFGGNITNEFRKYLKIMSRETSSPHRNNGLLLIDKSSLADRITEIEAFRLTYSYSEFKDEVLAIYENYMNSMLYLTQTGDVFDQETGNYKDNSKQILQEIINKYPDSHMSDVINIMLEKVETSNGIITPTIRKEISSMIP
ncbi:hypothetical protein [Gudongella sp. DL1XJH-153]|uniref:hypothetical protein n=1 Tax=Gudongella sp. DL1XJH-153 TaxID=3409804 RepID=UPI003BB793A4